MSEENAFLEITDKTEVEKLKLLYQQVKDKDKQFAGTPEAKAWAKDTAE